MGEPTNAEPGKCEKIDWFGLDDLPDDVVTYIRAGIDAYRRNQAFSLEGWQEQRSTVP
ncbi:hypothetical protein GCM10022224_082860 [Nonomuraea antimicrobica]|uniref:8-oxo-dGTP diphosphatase n=1 Tax=Nonomuraea antimicrobica TaxID=561173 RepID=A0ABP7DI25_9ACTN